MMDNKWWIINNWTSIHQHFSSGRPLTEKNKSRLKLKLKRKRLHSVPKQNPAFYCRVVSFLETTAPSIIITSTHPYVRRRRFHNWRRPHPSSCYICGCLIQWYDTRLTETEICKLSNMCLFHTPMIMDDNWYILDKDSKYNALDLIMIDCTKNPFSGSYYLFWRSYRLRSSVRSREDPSFV